MRMVERENRYFFAISLLFLLIVLFGFSPTFYLRPFFDRIDVSGTPDLPGHLVLHGSVMTIWYAILVLQAYLITTNDISKHRLLGYTALILALAVVLTGWYTTTHNMPRRIEAGLLTLEAVRQGSKGVLLGNLTGLTIFSILIAFAIYFRRKPQIHKRLMLFASLGVIGPAFGNLDNRGFGFITPLLPEFINPGIALVLFVICSLLILDKINYKRMLPVTLCVSALLISRIYVTPIIGDSKVWIEFSNWILGI